MDNITIIRIVAGLMFFVVLLLVAVIPYWVIFKKAGFAPALSILMAIPLVNLVVLYYVAFSEWKTGPGNVTLNPGPTLP